MWFVWFVHLALKLSLLTATVVALAVAPLDHALRPVPHPAQLSTWNALVETLLHHTSASVLCAAQMCKVLLRHSVTYCGVNSPSQCSRFCVHVLVIEVTFTGDGTNALPDTGSSALRSGGSSAFRP